MKVNISSSVSIYKPKNFTRKNTICSCITKIVDSNGKIIDTGKVKYSLEPKTNTSNNTTYKYNKRISIRYWGKFEEVLELPKIFRNLDENDFTIHTSNFHRDKILMPFIYISVENIEKYEILKTKEKRKEKLFEININNKK